MTIRYYLLDAAITTENYKQTKLINMDDVDPDKYLDCIESPLKEVAYTQSGVSADITKVLHCKTPNSLEAETDQVLDELKFLTDLTDVYKLISVNKERTRAVLQYMIAIDKVDQ